MYAEFPEVQIVLRVRIMEQAPVDGCLRIGLLEDTHCLYIICWKGIHSLKTLIDSLMSGVASYFMNYDKISSLILKSFLHGFVCDQNCFRSVKEGVVAMGVARIFFGGEHFFKKF